MKERCFKFDPMVDQTVGMGATCMRAALHVVELQMHDAPACLLCVLGTAACVRCPRAPGRFAPQVVHYATDGWLLHKTSEEAKRQASTMLGGLRECSAPD